MSLEYSRPCSVALSHKTFWCLLMMARATNKELAPLDVPATPDKLAEALLLAHIELESPKLLDLYKERKSIENEAVEMLLTKTNNHEPITL